MELAMERIFYGVLSISTNADEAAINAHILPQQIVQGTRLAQVAAVALLICTHATRINARHRHQAVGLLAGAQPRAPPLAGLDLQDRGHATPDVTVHRLRMMRAVMDRVYCITLMKGSNDENLPNLKTASHYQPGTDHSHLAGNQHTCSLKVVVGCGSALVELAPTGGTAKDAIAKLSSLCELSHCDGGAVRAGHRVLPGKLD
jgi:hypothetical protein